MNKVTLGPQAYVYPTPAFLVGANVDGKPTFMAVAYGGIANAEPPMISVALRHHRYTLIGIRQNLTFSVNVPSVDLVKETDFCGITTGSKVNKVEVCKFKVFYGKLNTAPLIEQCPLNLECRLVHMLDLGSHSLVIGRIEETYVSEGCVSDGQPDVSKMKPLICVAPARQYHAFGEVVARSHSIGRELRPRDQIYTDGKTGARLK